MKCTFGEVVEAQLRLVAFDLDDTLADSKAPISPDMAAALARLLTRFEVAVISGGQFSQFQTQVLKRLELGFSARTLHLLPTCGTRYYRRKPAGDIETVYVEALDPAVRQEVKWTLQEVATKLGLWEEHPWGEIIEDRGTQVTFSALGQNAPLQAKRDWDPDKSKRSRLVEALTPLLPGLEVRSGGSTSIDITAKGVDKAYGMRALLAAQSLEANEVLFVGDRLDPAGNDFPVVATGIPCQEVRDPQETLTLIEELLAPKS